MRDITIQILTLIGRTYTDKLSPRSGLTLGEVVESLVRFNSMKEASIVLNKTDSALEHLVRRNLRPLFLSKLGTESWDNYLLSLVNLRKCSTCHTIKPAKDFYGATPSSRCKVCVDTASNLNRPKYTEANRLRSKKHYIYNKHYYILKSSKRRRLLYRAMPLWADLLKLKEIYTNCPEGCHVDHIIPLQGKLVSGLHVESNLQYLSAKDNLIKGNKFLAT